MNARIAKKVLGNGRPYRLKVVRAAVNLLHRREFRRALRLYRENVYGKPVAAFEYGAVGDGTHDEGPAIERAIWATDTGED